MKKMFKKVLAAVCAMAMVMGMMAMSTFAADGKEVKVTVEWAEAAGQSVGLYTWEGADCGSWPGSTMTETSTGVFEITVTATGDTFNLIPNCSLGQTADITAVDATTGAVKVVVGAKGDDGKYTGTATAVSADSSAATTDTATGASSVMLYVVAAVVAVAGAVTVVCKKRSVEA